MKIGLIGHGNIAKILIENKPNHIFENVKQDSKYDVILVTRPMFVFINQYEKYKDQIDTTPTLFIPGNALNKEIFESRFPNSGIYFSFNTPYVGRWNNWEINNFKTIDILPAEFKELFGDVKRVPNKSVHLSNLFMHPPICYDYLKTKIGKEIKFYDINEEVRKHFDIYKNELLKIVGNFFPNLDIIDPYEYYDSINSKQFVNKLRTITSLSNIKFKCSKDELINHRYVQDDIIFKLNIINSKSINTPYIDAMTNDFKEMSNEDN